ncbi:DUF6297 family protein [Arthrobacter sp. AK01]|uniref:DUF6297 family protein n=1 Tax=Micrococcaceae TaxID=1268 RepID=UPI001E2E7517|nr:MULTISPECIES: DUF6297 family protein [Micrococcaceae]MCD4852375.1 DUF6297 family protein [Arthrobacter sp. AK01]MCP1411561.1 hypothetical protein [Paenarthrobacter sp. A20]
MPGPDTVTLSPSTQGRELAAAIVRFTHRSSRRYKRSRTSWGERFVDAYSWGLGIGVSLTIAASFVLALRNEIADRASTANGIIRTQWLVLPEEVLWTSVTFAALLVIGNLARKLGPMTVNGAEGSWWLTLPIDRRPMVLPPFLRKVVLTAAGSAIIYLPFSMVTFVDRAPREHLLASLSFGAAGAIALVLAALQQLRLLSPRIGKATTAAVLLGCSILPALASSPWPTALVGAAAVGLLSLVVPRAGQVRGEELVRGGAVAGHAGASLFMMDSNEVLRALSGGRQSVDGGRAARFYARPAGGPLRALIRADVVAFLRLNPPLMPPILWLAACIAMLLVEGGLPEFAQLAVIVIAGCATASGMGSVARKTALVPELDALLPLHPALVRTSRTLMPCAAMALWMAILSGLLVLLGAADPWLIGVGALAGVGMGAGTLRAATRTPPDWTAPPVETPFGPVPRAQLGSLMRGLDVTVLATIPLVVALYLGYVPLLVVMVQAVFSAGIFLVVVLTRAKRS